MLEQWLKPAACAATFLVALVALGLSAPQASAQALVSTGESFVNARFLPGIPQENGTRLAGLRLSLKEGWKTYWRSPGEAGIPPRFDWSASTNLESAEILWPRPEVFNSFGMQTIGYGGQIVLPIVITPQDPSLPLQISATVDMGVCREICVLERFDLTDTILPDTPAIGTRQINRAVKQMPPLGTDVGLVSAECTIKGAGKTRKLDVALNFDDAPSGAIVLFEGPEHTWINKAQTQSGTDPIRATADLHLIGDASWIDRGALRMTVLAEGFSADIHGCTAPQR